MLILLGALSQNCVSRMNPNVSPTKANMSMTCSGEPKCVSVEFDELYDSVGCPMENQVCGVLRAFVEEYTNEIPEGVNLSDSFTFQMCGYFTDQATCQMHCEEECVKTKKTTVPYSTKYYYRSRTYKGGRPKGSAKTGEWICPGHGLSSGAIVGISSGVVFGVTAVIFVFTAVQWRKARRNK